MTYLFFVQGEGRGHFSQALTLKEKLEKRGHRVLAIIVGLDRHNKIPTFFKEQIDVPLFKIASPGFVTDRRQQGIKIGTSIIKNLILLPFYLNSLKQIKNIVTHFNPDALVNFYEIMAGNYCRFHQEKRPLFSIGHQYFIHHPHFHFPKGQALSKFFFKLYNNLNAPQKSVRIALSFTAEKDLTDKKLFICPPLIKSAIKNQTPENKNFILTYILNPGYSQEITNWSQKHPEIRIEAFWSGSEQEKTIISPSLTFRRLSGPKFIELLSSCHAYASTAGFDSISEAAYLQKSILMVPTKHHFEQKCNAVDAGRAGLALSSQNFNLDLISDETNNQKNTPALQKFKAWVDNNDDKIVSILEQRL